MNKERRNKIKYEVGKCCSCGKTLKDIIQHVYLYLHKKCPSFKFEIGDKEEVLIAGQHFVLNNDNNVRCLDCNCVRRIKRNFKRARAKENNYEQH